MQLLIRVDLELIRMDFAAPDKVGSSRELILMDFAAPDKNGFRTNMDGFCSY